MVNTKAEVRMRKEPLRISKDQPACQTSYSERGQAIAVPYGPVLATVDEVFAVEISRVGIMEAEDRARAPNRKGLVGWDGYIRDDLVVIRRRFERPAANPVERTRMALSRYGSTGNSWRIGSDEWIERLGQFAMLRLPGFQGQEHERRTPPSLRLQRAGRQTLQRFAN
jgi:hypothetical protein